jgi:predicted dehydrogenase
LTKPVIYTFVININILSCDRKCGEILFQVPRQDDLELGGGYMYDIGCYQVQLALLAFNHEKPESIHAVGWKNETGMLL